MTGSLLRKVISPAYSPRIPGALHGRGRAALLNARAFPTRLTAWLGFRRHIGEYHILREDELRSRRRSDTVFVFGSGASLNGLSVEEWRAIEAHDTVGFNWFVHQRFVRCDFQIFGEIGGNDLDPAMWRPHIRTYFDLIDSNSRFDHTVFLVQTGFRAINGNRAIGLRLLSPSRPVFLWRRLRGRVAPSRSLAEGLVHAHGSLADSVNFAFLMGWTTIVLAGVDLYDRRYFWLEPDELRPDEIRPHAPVPSEPISVELRHNTADTGLVDLLGSWREQFARSGVRLFVYNPRSLLARTVPVWPPAAEALERVSS
jgi:hypothetical protein